MSDFIVYSGVVMVPQKVTVRAENAEGAMKLIHDSFRKEAVGNYPAKVLELKDTGERVPNPEPWNPPSIA